MEQVEGALEKNLGSPGWLEYYPACRLTTGRAAPRVQTGTGGSQIGGRGKLCLSPAPLSLDSWNTFHLQHTPPKLPVAGATLAVASA